VLKNTKLLNKKLFVIFYLVISEKMNNKNNLLSQLYMLKLFGYNYINKVNIINNTKVTLPDNINELNQRISNCNLCELSKVCTSKVLYNNTSNPTIAVLVPKLLVNNELNILMKILNKYFNTDLDDIVILNIIKCDANNIKINNNIFDKCKDYTIKELDIISAKFIFSFGDIYKYIVKNDLDVGEGIIYNNSKLFYLNELNELLRNPSILEENENIFYKIKHEMEKY